ncbi:ethanolamine-phosphate cytidylyltransferase [Schistosoma mansoni]|uniref:Uridine kinase n=1 Tax=Schistosoma mansoni TaxID=6183 RepID=G4VLZ9_SCHMA|nr:ethanolamine-phosphate cytidylyltransferase [Schistosoma mansoni]|eukprot:XP_018653103.1 ethanolamine-phosphate cytidylyltransferase [Schistosoma mansoni]
MASSSESDISESSYDQEVTHTDVPRINKSPKVVSVSSTAWGLPEPVLRVGNRTIFTHGRPPWYNAEGQTQQPFVIGICGGSASGKTSVARVIIESLDVQWVSLLSLDSYYKVLTPEQKLQAVACHYNFDHPSAFDLDLLENHLRRLRDGKTIEVPEYDFKTHSRTSKTNTVYGANIIIIEGILVFYSQAVAKLMDLKVFVDTDADERLSRRLRRDISERGRELNSVLEQYMRFVKPSYEQFIAPSMAQADIIVPRGGKNVVALQLIVQHINKRLKQCGLRTRHKFAKFPFILPNGALPTDSNDATWEDNNSTGVNNTVDDVFTMNNHLYNNKQYTTNGTSDKACLPPRVHVLPSTPQRLGLHTLIRDQSTDQDAFVFYAERLMRPLCEAAMNLLPHMDIDIETPQGITYRGRKLATGTQVCGVSILRAGEVLEPALCAVCKDIRLGKILIQTNPVTSEPELHYIRLPRDIKDCFVILMDATVATGAAAIMAMRILVEHDVPEDKIILISLIMASQGVHSVAYTYPKAHIVTTAVDSGLNDSYHIVPGVGNFGDRYFGTTLDLETR